MALMLALAACGQKGPLFLPAQAGVAAKSAPMPPLQAASSPVLPPAAK